MKELGGYIELDTYKLPMLHDDAIALNCGRNALAYLFKSRGITKLKVPYFLCDSVSNVCDREGVEKVYYHIEYDFRPEEDLTIAKDEWLYLVNFYGQLSNEKIRAYAEKYERIIVDQANGYFESPVPGVDTLYTCRKWFGVADGAFLYTDKPLTETFPQDISFERMHFLLGRFEKEASLFYGEYTENNRFFTTEPIKEMSRLTRNLLHGIDYQNVEKIRKENFEYLHSRLSELNLLQLKTGAFMYPFMIENGERLRKELQNHRIYVPLLWPAVFTIASENDPEYKMAKNILPLPIDQRYSIEDMEYIVKIIYTLLEVSSNG